VRTSLWVLWLSTLGACVRTSPSPDGEQQAKPVGNRPLTSPCGDGVTACVLQCGAAEDWTPLATCSSGGWQCDKPRMPAVQCAVGAYAELLGDAGACGPRPSVQCVSAGNFRPPACRPETRLWTCSDAGR
jgi:hypothetical protein